MIEYVSKIGIKGTSLIRKKKSIKQKPLKNTNLNDKMLDI